MNSNPPSELTLWHCNGCGRTEFYNTKFIHYYLGKQCTGEQSSHTYQLSSDTTPNEEERIDAQFPGEWEED